jgi:UPF0755 protein
MTRRKPKPLLIILLILLSLILIGVGTYLYLGTPVDASDNTTIEVEIPSGTGTNGIAKILKTKGLIRNELYFTLIAKLKNYNNLKANTYGLKKNMSVITLLKKLSSNSNYGTITITFIEGKRITDYATTIAKYTNNSYDDVIATFKDTTYMKELISKYWFLSDSILNTSIYYPLEGYLAPDTYEFKNKDVSVKTIIEKLLTEEENKLSPYKASLGSDTHNILTMASLVELEAETAKDRALVAGVFTNRLNAKMNLGSDVTTYYALQVPLTTTLSSADYNTINPYNTRTTNMAGKLPVGPICNPSTSSIAAALNPTSSKYYYFVASKSGTIYYSETFAEQQKVISELKSKGDWS